MSWLSAVSVANYRSDLMDRFLDVYDTDDLHYGTTSVYAEVKKEGS